MRGAEEIWFTVMILCGGFLIMAEGEIYIVLLEGESVVSYTGGIVGFEATAVDSDQKMDTTSEWVTSYSKYLVNKHNMLLGLLFENGTYNKLYSYTHLINGFALQISPEQAELLGRAPGVKSVQRDLKVTKLTTHTPEFLGLPTGVWPTSGGSGHAGEGVVIGIVDSGIYPLHPSFATYNTDPYDPIENFLATCERDVSTKMEFCNGKIIGAQHFAKAAIADGAFNSGNDFASPLDGDGHGSHTAAIAAGNIDITLRMHGYELGKASGMAPRARIAVYKALYRLFGGFVADVVAAIDQAVFDGVDILNLSVGPNSPSSASTATFLSPLDAALLSAVKAGVFVVQAAGNGGPYPKSLLSFSPWITSVGAVVDDRKYQKNMYLENGKIIMGIGLSRATPKNQSHVLVAANDVLLDTVSRYNSSDCQVTEVFNRKLVEGNILVCGYSFNFVSGKASIKKVSEIAKSLGAVGFVLAVEDNVQGEKFDLVVTSIPGMLITDPSKSKVLINYYNMSTLRDSVGRVTNFNARGRFGDGVKPILQKSAPVVALFSSRGPNFINLMLQEADVLKPDFVAPGSRIWAAWSLIGTDEPNYLGEGFAMMSGTSMAAPHVAGIAALVKQKHPSWSPAAIKSALMTTSSTVNKAGNPIRAEVYSGISNTIAHSVATPFDMGSGHVDPNAALDPGLIFDAGYEDYIGFLCATPGIDPNDIYKHTKSRCNRTFIHPSDFNTPSITVSRLVRTQVVTRTVKNVGAEDETYATSGRMPPEIAIRTDPPAMTLKHDAHRTFTVTLTPRFVTGKYSFGEVLLKGSRGHRVRLPVVAMAYRR